MCGRRISLQNVACKSFNPGVVTYVLPARLGALRGEHVKGALTLARGLLYLHEPKVAAQENYTAVASRKARACSSDALLKNRIQGIA